MSKWFSARSKAALAAVLLLAACDRFLPQGEEGAVPSPPGGLITTPDTSVDEVASAQPGIERNQWRPATENARTLTGNVTASVEGRGGPLLLAFANGITLELLRDVSLPASEPLVRGGPSFAEVLNADRSAQVYLYSVTREDLARAATQGGLCRLEKTTHVAVSEFVGPDGEWKFKIAAFKGAVPPGPDATETPILCGSYQYVRA